MNIELGIFLLLSIIIVLRVISIFRLRRDFHDPFMLRIDWHCMRDNPRLLRFYWNKLKKQKCQYYILGIYCAVSALAYFGFDLHAPLLLIVYGAINAINWYTLKGYVARVSPAYLFLFEDV